MSTCLLCGELVSRGKIGPHSRVCSKHLIRSQPTELQKKTFYQKKIIEFFDQLLQIVNANSWIELIAIFETAENQYPKERIFNGYDFLQPPDEYVQNFASDKETTIKTIKWMLSPLAVFKVLRRFSQLETNDIIHQNSTSFVDELHVDIALDSVNDLIQKSKESLEKSLALQLPEEPNTQNRPNLLNIDIHIPEDYLPFDENPFPVVQNGDATPTYED